MPVIASPQPWNTATFSATAIWCAAVSSDPRSASSAPRSASRSSARESSKSARTSTSGSTRRWSPETPSPGTPRSGVVRPRLVAECSQPSGPEKSTSLRAASAGVDALARLVVEQLPARVADRRMRRSRWFIARLLSGCRSPGNLRIRCIEPVRRPSHRCRRLPARSRGRAGRRGSRRSARRTGCR